MNNFGFFIDNLGNNETTNVQPDKSKSLRISELKAVKDTFFGQASKSNSTNKKLDLTEAVLNAAGWNNKGDETTQKWKMSISKNALNEIKSKETKMKVKKALEKSVITPEFESLHEVPPCEVSKRKLQKERRKEREKTKGKNWFGIGAPEITEEVKRDLEILQMRSVLDPKHFYKKNDLNVLPKYFQIGKVMHSPLDFYNNRLTKKERKKTLVDELLADAEFQKYNKRKYNEIVEEKQKTHYKAWRRAKRLKKKK